MRYGGMRAIGKTRSALIHYSIKRHTGCVLSSSDLEELFDVVDLLGLVISLCPLLG